MSDFDPLAGPPGRPDHPDFWRLSDILLAHDGKTEDAGFDFATYLATVIDPKVVAYMAEQRAMRLGISDKAGRVVAVALWLDAFMAGAEWGRRAASHG